MRKILACIVLLAALDACSQPGFTPRKYPVLLQERVVLMSDGTCNLEQWDGNGWSLMPSFNSCSEMTAYAKQNNYHQNAKIKSVIYQ